MQFSSREILNGIWRHQTRLEIFGALSAGSRVTIPARYVRTCRRQSCWPSWPFAVRPRFIAGRDLGSRPLVPNVGLVGFLLLLGRLRYGLLGHSYCSMLYSLVFSARLLGCWESRSSTWWKMSCRNEYSLYSALLRLAWMWEWRQASISIIMRRDKDKKLSRNSAKRERKGNGLLIEPT